MVKSATTIENEIGIHKPLVTSSNLLRISGPLCPGSTCSKRVGVGRLCCSVIDLTLDLVLRPGKEVTPLPPDLPEYQVQGRHARLSYRKE